MNALARLLARRISLAGPLTLADFMAEALGHPEHGYYRRGDPLGAGGDFITAPEVSQMFGEIVGLWCVESWRLLGSPTKLRLIELGPGRGTLMADALRAARLRPAFIAAIDLHLVETSPALRARQEAALRDGPVAPSWHDDLTTLPGGPWMLVANELFDALPIHQFERTERGWRERVVGIGPDGALRLGLARPGPALALVPPDLSEAEVGAVVEVCPAAIGLASRISRHIATEGGIALIVDYGHDAGVAGDSLQSVRRHRRHDPLEAPGEADITAHVDFAALARCAREAGAGVHGPLPQGQWLERLGLRMRAERLRERAGPDQGRDIDAAVRRLLDPSEMGTLFKALALSAPGLATLPGFRSGDARNVSEAEPHADV